MSICLGHTSYVELAQVKFYKNLPPYSHCVWQKSSATSPSFARKNWMPCDSLGCRDFGTSKNPVVQTAIVMSTCSEKTWISAERVFTNQPTSLWQGLLFFFKGWVSPLLSQPGFFLKIFHSDLVFPAGDIRPPVSASWTPPSQPADGFTGGFHWWNGVYIYIWPTTLALETTIYIYMFSSCIFEYWLKPGRILAETSGKTKLLGREVRWDMYWMDLDGLFHVGWFAGGKWTYTNTNPARVFSNM